MRRCRLVACSRSREFEGAPGLVPEAKLWELIDYLGGEAKAWYDGLLIDFNEDFNEILRQ